MEDCKPVGTPMGPGTRLTEEQCAITPEDKEEMKDKPYQHVVGKLNYLAIGTRPDISFAVGRLAQYAANPSKDHTRLAKYVLAYLKGTADYKLRYDGMSKSWLCGYSDSSLADQPDDFHSTSSYLFLLSSGAISWSSRKQKTIAQSTTHAEYMAMTDASNQAQWYREFLLELGYDVEDPIPLHGDNKGAIDLAINPVTGRRSKHIGIKFHAIREYMETSVIDLVRTRTEDMLADGFTKSLPKVNLWLLNECMGLV